jgi:hypothetical protein
MIVNGDVSAMPGLLLHSAKAGRRSAPHPAEPELPRARAELRALRSAACSAAAVGDGCSAPCGAELFFLRDVTREDAPHRIRQSWSCRGREQSFAHSGVRHALLPPVGD